MSIKMTNNMKKQLIRKNTTHIKNKNIKIYRDKIFTLKQEHKLM